MPKYLIFTSIYFFYLTQLVFSIHSHGERAHGVKFRGGKGGVPWGAEMFLQICARNYYGTQFIVPSRGLMLGTSRSPGPAGDWVVNLRIQYVSMTLQPQLLSNS